MLTLCICDDNQQDIARILDMTRRFAREHPEFSLRPQTFSSPLDLLEHLEGRGGFDLYLLDILMPRLKGLELAERIRDMGKKAELIFLTSSREYALDAFEVEACGYLLKPVDWEKFQHILLSAVRRLEEPGSPFILLKVKEGLRKIFFQELVMVESFNHSRVCTLTDGSKAVTADTLASLLGLLSADSRFFSPHRAYIINLEHVTALNASHVLMTTGQRVPVSRSSLSSLKKAYVDYIF